MKKKKCIRKNVKDIRLRTFFQSYRQKVFKRNSENHTINLFDDVLHILMLKLI